MADAALEAISRASGLWNTSSPRELVRQVRRVAELLESTQPAMGIFRRWASEWYRFAQEKRPTALQRNLDRWTAGWRAQLHLEMPALLRVVRQRFPALARVITISRGSSVYLALLGLCRSQRPREVIVLESRPGGEGRLLARDLRRSGVTARSVPDTEAPSWVRKVDRVLIGADTIYADGSVVHKVGTRALALAAHRHGVPVVVVSGLSKAVAQRRPAHRLPALFDVTPPRAITEYWTDHGVRLGGRWTGIPPRRPTRLSGPRG